MVDVYQITSRLAGEAHVTRRLSSATFVEPKSGLPRPIVFCTRCGVYATNKAMGIKKPCTPPWTKQGKRERVQHHSQHGLEDMAVIAACSARHDNLPSGAVAEQPRASKGGTGTSLKTLNLKRHPQHRCPLTEIQPLSKKGRKAITQTEPSDDGEVEMQIPEAEINSPRQELLANQEEETTMEQANFQSNMMELEELEQQAMRAVGMDVAPEEEDVFCELAM